MSFSEKTEIYLEKMNIAYQMLSLELEIAFRLTNKEIYAMNKLKRAFHEIKVHARKLRKKHGKAKK